jgi:DNA-binding transcriptional MerR regulator
LLSSKYYTEIKQYLHYSKLYYHCREFEERLEKAQIDKENTVEETNKAWLLEINMRKASFQERIHELEEKLTTVQMEHQKAIKEETEKLQHECKTQLETIRSRFKLMAASTMERSPSDSSLEKIEVYLIFPNIQTIFIQCNIQSHSM